MAKKQPGKNDKFHFNGYIPMSLWRMVLAESHRVLRDEGDDIGNIGVVRRALKEYFDRRKGKPSTPEHKPRSNGAAVIDGRQRLSA